jgi:acyl dehydratase
MSEREFQSAPGMAGLFARAGLAMIPGAAALPVVGGRRAADTNPDEVLVLRDAAIDRDRLAAYAKVCGFGLGDRLPASYPHMLAFPLHLALMTDPRFPFPAIGLVHIYNRIVQHRPISADERLDLRVWAEPIEPHPRGRQVSIRSEARVGAELVWEEVSTNLRRGRGEETATLATVASAKDLPATATWTLSGDLGRRYAAVSGDYNPIHVHPLTARLFGFPAAIAHGMWTKARCLAALGPRLPESFSVEVAFKRPIVLPAKVEFAEGEGRFGVRGTRKPGAHLDGAFSSL